jgi:hypothetical protein
MADPKTDTVRIALPARPEQAAADASAANQDTARIVLPSRPPVTSVRRLPPTIRPFPPAEDESAMAAPSATPGPKQETARISVLPRPALVAPAVITSRPVARVDDTPRPLAWGLLGISAVIFLIQIWNYVVS